MDPVKPGAIKPPDYSDYEKQRTNSSKQLSQTSESKIDQNPLITDPFGGVAIIAELLDETRG